MEIKNLVSFFVDGISVPKQSFRVIAKEANGKVKVSGYRSPRVTNWQDTIKYSAKSAINEARGGKEFDGMVGVLLEFYLPTARRVDSDNLSKGVLDALNKVFWRDDSSVVDLRIIKIVRSKTPGVRITVWGVPDNLKENYIGGKDKK